MVAGLSGIFYSCRRGAPARAHERHELPAMRRNAEASRGAAALPRVLVLVASPSIPGPIPKITPLLVSALAKAGCDVATHPWSRREESEPVLRKLRDRGLDLIRIVGLVWRWRPSVMLATTSHDSRAMLRDLPLVLTMRLLGCPCVLQFHGSLPNVLSERGHWVFKISSRLLVRLSGTVLLLSSEECRLWRAFDPCPRYCLVANPYVTPRRLIEVQEESAADGRVSPPVVLYVGRLLRAKGTLDLVKAFPEVIQASGAVLELVGDGPDRAACESLASDLGINENVGLPGYLTGEALLKAYERATVFAYPSYWPEGFPTVLSEAMAAGLPIVTTATRGAVDHLHEPENALFVPPRDPDALAGAISRLVQDSELVKKMGDANREKVKAFAPDVVVHAYIDALQSAVTRGQRGRKAP